MAAASEDTVVIGRDCIRADVDSMKRIVMERAAALTELCEIAQTIRDHLRRVTEEGHVMRRRLLTAEAKRDELLAVQRVIAKRRVRAKRSSPNSARTTCGLQTGCPGSPVK